MAFFVVVNTTTWGGVKWVEKAEKIVNTGLSVAYVVIGISHVLEDLACQDYGS